MPSKYADFVNAQAGSELEKELGKGTENMVSQEPNKNINVYQPGGSSKQFESSGGFQSQTIPEQGTHKANLFELVNDIPDQEFKLEMMAIQNEYQKSNHQTIQTSSNTSQYDMGDKISQEMANMRIQEAKMKYTRTKLMFQKYQQDNTLSREDSFDAKMRYIKTNPIFKMPKEDLKPEKPTFPRQYVETHLGKIATGDFPKDIAEENISDREKALKTAERVFNTDPNNLMPEVKAKIDEAYPKEQEQPQGENIFSKIGKALGAAASSPKEWLTDPQFQRKAQGLPIQEEGQQQRPKQQIQQTPTAPKPQGYPDAVWSSQYGMWTVIKGGKLVGLKGME